MTWNDVFYIARWILDMFPDGPVLNVYEQSFDSIAQGIRCGMNNSKHAIDAFNYVQLHNKSRTLIVVYGQLRTFETTCVSILEHVVKANMPATVVFSVESHEQLLIGQTRQCLDAYTNYIILTEGSPCINRGTAFPAPEFCWIERAINAMGSDIAHYDYLLVTRADNFYNADIRVATAYGTHPNFFHSFLHFEAALQQVMSN